MNVNTKQSVGCIGDAITNDVIGPVPTPAKKKCGRGPAKCIEFEKLRKHGKIHLKINDGEMAPCCSNAAMFTTRITWILKHHADMSHARWTDVPQPEKDELIERIKVSHLYMNGKFMALNTVSPSFHTNTS